MNGFMTVTSAASVSKGDIELLENKISVLEKQISKIKKKHVKVLSDQDQYEHKVTRPSENNRFEDQMQEAQMVDCTGAVLQEYQTP